MNEVVWLVTIHGDYFDETQVLGIYKTRVRAEQAIEEYKLEWWDDPEDVEWHEANTFFEVEKYQVE